MVESAIVEILYLGRVAVLYRLSIKVFLFALEECNSIAKSESPALFKFSYTTSRA